MNELIETLLGNEIKVIEVLTEKLSNEMEIDWFDDTKKQWIVTNYDYMIVYTDDNGYITDVAGFEQVGDKWYLVTFAEDKIDIQDSRYTAVCDLSMFKKVSFKL